MKKLYIPRTNCNQEKVESKLRDISFKGKIDVITANKGYALFPPNKGEYWISELKIKREFNFFDNLLLKRNDIGWYLSSPIEIGIDITKKCNQRCIHCWNESGDGKTNIQDRLFYDIIQQFGERGGQKVELSGGELFLHPSLINYLSFLKESRISRIGLTTNATLINKDVAKEISPFIKNIGVSLHASNKKLNEKITRRRSSFRRTIKGIENLLAEDMNVILLHVIMPENQRDLEPFFKLSNNLGINYVKFNSLRPIGRAKNKKSYPLQELERLRYDVLELEEKYRITCDISALFSKIDLNEEFEFYGSNALRNYLKVNSNGKCTPSPFSENIIGNLNYQTLEEIWFGKKASKVRNKMLCPNPRCKLRDRCGGLWQKL